MNHEIDLQYRPETYFQPQHLEDHLLAKVRGSTTRRYLQELIDEGRRDDVVALIASGLDLEEQKTRLESVHPGFMSGNYLPELEYGEVEITRIWIDSTTGDVTCVYAKSVDGKIHYRVVDEYDGDTLDSEGKAVTDEPMTLKEFVDFFFASWSLIECLRCNFENDPEEMMGFFRCESHFYPEFDAYARVLVEAEFPPLEDEDESEDYTPEISDITVTKVTGVVRLQVWIRTYSNFYKVETSEGPAILAPNIDDSGIGRVCFGNFAVSSARKVFVRLLPDILQEAERLRPELESLKTVTF